MHLLKTPPPESPKLAPIPAVKCISLDPWLETLPIPAPPTPDSPDIPLLVVNSPGFTTWKEHFERLVKQVKEGNGTLLTLLKSERASHSVALEALLTGRSIILRLPATLALLPYSGFNRTSSNTAYRRCLPGGNITGFAGTQGEGARRGEHSGEEGSRGQGRTGSERR